MRLAESVTFGTPLGDRAAHMRRDRAELDRAHATGRILALWRGKPLIDASTRDRLIWLDAPDPLAAMDPNPIFLGLDGDGRGLFAVDVSSWEPPENQAGDPAAFFDPSEQHHPSRPENHRFSELRGIMARLPPEDAARAATARAVLNWHLTHRFCARCGGASEMVEAGWQRTCRNCGSHHFPRTDPVVIMLITRGNRVLVGRSPQWPENMYSLLAGFVEPGETIETAVRREVLEETGVAVGPVDYLSSQPWPYPMSLMFGCRGRALTDEINIDPEELEDARWLTRERVRDTFAGIATDISPARKGSIARFLLRNWLADRLA